MCPTKKTSKKSSSRSEASVRLARLTFLLSNVLQPISTREIYRLVYQTEDDFIKSTSPNTSEKERKSLIERCEKAFARDRKLLKSLGITLSSSQDATQQNLWILDRSSTIDTSLISPLDMQVVDVMCRHLLSDKSFPYREDLVQALLKINASFIEGDELPAVELSEESVAGRTLIASYLQRLPAHITYKNADSEIKEHDVAVFGMFELRQNLYFVCQDITKNISELHSLKTYRSDRILKAKLEADAKPYTIPLDFSVDDYRLLPFQIGSQVCEGLFSVPAARERDVKLLLNNKTRLIDRDGQLLLVASLSDISLAAGWALAEGLTPLEPADLVREWENLLKGVLESGAAHANK